MNAYKFETTVLEDGILKIPELKKLANQVVQVFIFEKNDPQKDLINRPLTTYEDFSKKWRGFLKGAKIENWKDDYTNYLMEKYQ